MTNTSRVSTVVQISTFSICTTVRLTKEALSHTHTWLLSKPTTVAKRETSHRFATVIEDVSLSLLQNLTIQRNQICRVPGIISQKTRVLIS
jgi:hypothetical protein